MASSLLLGDSAASTLILINLGLVAVLFAFLVSYLMIYRRRRYYRRIRLNRPEINKTVEEETNISIKWIGVGILILLILCVIFMFVFNFSKGAQDQNIATEIEENISEAGTQELAAANEGLGASLPEAETHLEAALDDEDVEETEVIAVQEPSTIEPDTSANTSEKNKLGGAVQGFMLTYAGYILAGIIILIILISVLSSRKTE